MRQGPQLVEKALLQGVPSSADDGIKSKSVISRDMRLGNDTSHEIFKDIFARNRVKNFVQSNSKKWLCHFFDSLKAPVSNETGALSFQHSSPQYQRHGVSAQ